MPRVSSSVSASKFLDLIQTLDSKQAPMKYLIVNADDFGWTKGITDGILEAHERGIVTSTSLMVDRKAAAYAAALAPSFPHLSLGLHFDSPDGDFDVVSGLNRQFQKFLKLVKKPPTHIDSHHHFHKSDSAMPIFQKFAAQKNIPLRFASKAVYVGDFHGAWYDEAGVHPAPENITYESLEKILTGLSAEVSELCVHPGFISIDLDDSYTIEREQEQVVLSSERWKKNLHDFGIELINFNQYDQRKNCL